jgi:hypothetical protein
MEEYKTLQYGVSNFRTLIQKNGYYVDKTSFIEKMERMGNFLVLLRPRRFGKSLFLSMLGCYYDIKERDNFDTLFKNTWIANHPTEERGNYQILMLDFSRIGNKSTKDLEESFNTYCCDRVNRFMSKYKAYYPEDVFKSISECSSFVTKLNRLNDYIQDECIQLCLLIDEYDNFTNTILASEGHEVYHAVTHADGFYRDVFKLFKGMFSRIVLTGVSPVTLDDLTSGFNITQNISLSETFNQVQGFSSEEVRQIIRYYKGKGVKLEDEEKMMSEMAAWFDGYCFAFRSLNAGEHVFNSTMAIKYIKSYLDVGHAPDNLLDNNTRIDYTKLQQLIKLDHLNGNRQKSLIQIAQDGYTWGNVCDSFSAEQLTSPNIFTSLLFYYGMLTYANREPFGIVLGIPNKNVRKLFYDYLTEEFNKILPMDLSALESRFNGAAVDGKWREMIEFLCQKLHESSSIRCMIEGERNAQGFLLAYLSLSSYYLTAPEVEVNHGYCDFFLMPNTQKVANIAHSYIIELKYLSTTDTDTKAAAQWQEAVAQLHQYVQAPKVRLLSSGTTLHGIVLQIKGTELLRTEEVVSMNFR